jgi:CDP-4-dehydro-6-deoxyglucose reductase
VTFEITTATVKDIYDLNTTMVRYLIKPQKYITYIAGQYLQIKFLDDASSYSIANAPLGVDYYELHIRHNNNSQALSAMQKHARLTIKLPFGDCHLQAMHAFRPIIFIAIGSGFAPIKAMLEQLFFSKDLREKKLYWGVRTEEDLYSYADIVKWQQHDKNFKYIPYISQINEGSLIAKIINENYENLFNYQIVLCGPFELIYQMRDVLLAQGVDKLNLYSDAFSFE